MCRYIDFAGGQKNYKSKKDDCETSTKSETTAAFPDLQATWSGVFAPELISLTEAPAFSRTSTTAALCSLFPVNKRLVAHYQIVTHFPSDVSPL